MKISFFGMWSIFGIPHFIKGKAWVFWERRQLFLDDKQSHGLITAYKWAKGYMRQWSIKNG